MHENELAIILQILKVSLTLRAADIINSQIIEYNESSTWLIYDPRSKLLVSKRMD